MGMRGGSRSCANSDDLVLALAIAVWRADGGGIASWGIFELTRRQAEQAGGPTVRAPRYYVGVVRLWFVMLRNGRRRPTRRTTAIAVGSRDLPQITMRAARLSGRRSSGVGKARASRPVKSHSRSSRGARGR
jgi:hypothetical protein